MEYTVNLKGLFLFELKSFLGRNFKKTTPKLFSETNYLNLGSGSNIVEGYVNADFFNSFKSWKKNNFKLEWELDLRYPLNCKDDCFDGIFSEHTFEHLYPSQVRNLLNELYRVLKTNSHIRITVPDLEKYVQFYNKEESSPIFETRFLSGCQAIRNLSQNYLHLSLWDYHEMKKYLEEAGFVEVEQMTFGKSRNEKLLLDKEDRSWETLYIEARKV